MITGITHVAVRVSDIERSTDFYTKALGLTEKFRLNNDQGELVLVYLQAAPGQFVELFPAAGTVDGECATLLHICFEVDDIQRTYRDFIDSGVVCRGEPVLGADRSWQFWTSDPDGTPIEFHQFTSESMQLK